MHDPYFSLPILSRIGSSSILLSYFVCFGYVWVAILFRAEIQCFFGDNVFGHLFFLVFCFAFFLVSNFIRDRGFRRKSDEYNEINTAFLLRDNVYVLL